MFTNNSRILAGKIKSGEITSSRFLFWYFYLYIRVPLC